LLLCAGSCLILAIGLRKERTIKNLSFTCGLVALLTILVFPAVIFVLPFKVGFAVPELVEGLIVAVWTVFMSTRLLRQQRLIVSILL
jgi:hypothetical membrane protein